MVFSVYYNFSMSCGVFTTISRDCSNISNSALNWNLVKSRLSIASFVIHFSLGIVLYSLQSMLPCCAQNFIMHVCVTWLLLANEFLWDFSFRRISDGLPISMGAVQDSTNSSALAMELLQSCTEPSISSRVNQAHYRHTTLIFYMSYIHATDIILTSKASL